MTATQLLGIIEHGMDGLLVTIECHITNGLPSIIIVGSANKAVDEAKERLRGAFSASSLQMPKKRITINLAPGDIPKESSGLDVSIAIAILVTSGQLPPAPPDSLFLGELGLGGDVRAVRGLIGKLTTAKRRGVHTVFIPADNLPQASLIPGLQLFPAHNLREIYEHLSGVRPLQAVQSVGRTMQNTSAPAPAVDMSDVVGQATAKRALEIAAAGGHNILLNGPPGTGKSMLAKAFLGIMPPMTADEILEATQIHSLAHDDFDHIIATRPLRAPHHTASNVSIVGGGRRPKPGEISLSHSGVLFLDEILEFNRSTIEALRQPLEDRSISVSRASGSTVFPARFILVATSNPCPCGHYGSTHPCECLPAQIAKYQRKLSGPIIERIDLHVDVDEVAHKHLLRKQKSEPSQTIQQRVEHARNMQAKRLGSDAKTNSTMDNKQIKTLAKLSSDAEVLLNKAGDTLLLSPRSYMKSIKVARTIADLDDSETIESRHIAEALQFRRRETTFL